MPLFLLKIVSSYSRRSILILVRHDINYKHIAGVNRNSRKLQRNVSRSLNFIPRADSTTTSVAEKTFHTSRCTMSKHQNNAVKDSNRHRRHLQLPLQPPLETLPTDITTIS